MSKTNRILPFASRVSYINKTTSTSERLFDKMYRDLGYATRATDRSKTIQPIGLQLLSNLISLLRISKNKKICIDHDFITNITGKKTDQNKNLLLQLTDFIQFKYHRKTIFEGKKHLYAYVIEFTNDGEERALNPAKFYLLDNAENGKKIGYEPEKIRLSFLRENKEKEKEPRLYRIDARAREDFSDKSFETIDKTINQIVSTLAYGSFGEPAKVTIPKEEVAEIMLFPQEPTQEENPPEFLQVLEPPKTPNPVQSQPIIETMQNNTITDYKSNEAVLRERLSTKICNEFGSQEGSKVVGRCRFVVMSPNKIGIDGVAELNLTNDEKDRLRQCVRTVYGENIQTVALNSSTERKNESLRDRFLNRLEDMLGKHVVKNWFSKLESKEILSENKLILTTPSSFVFGRIHQDYGNHIENVIKGTEIKIELICSDQRIYTIYNKPRMEVYPFKNFDPNLTGVTS